MEIIIIRIMIKLLNQYLFYVTPAKTISTESTRNDLYYGMCGLVIAILLKMNFSKAAKMIYIMACVI